MSRASAAPPLPQPPCESSAAHFKCKAPCHHETELLALIERAFSQKQSLSGADIKLPNCKDKLRGEETWIHIKRLN